MMEKCSTAVEKIYLGRRVRVKTDGVGNSNSSGSFGGREKNEWTGMKGEKI